MLHSFHCAQCGKAIAAEAAPATPVMCPFCGQLVTVPAEPAGIGPLEIAYATSVSQPRTGLAIASLVCGIVGCLCSPVPVLSQAVGVAGLIMGLVAMARVRRDPRRYGGRGMAIGGIATGLLSLALFAVVLRLMIPALARGRELARRAACAQNLAQVGQGLSMYVQKYGDSAEAGSHLRRRLVNGGFALPRNFVCPSDKSGGACSYHFVPRHASAAPGRRIVAYEDAALHGGEGGNVLYADGTVNFVRAPALKRLVSSMRPPDGSTHEPDE